MEFPRDVQFEILKHIDMETRIKIGLIGKLKIPDHLTKKLQNISKVKALAFRHVFYIELGYDEENFEHRYVIHRSFPKYETYVTAYRFDPYDSTVFRVHWG